MHMVAINVYIYINFAINEYTIYFSIYIDLSAVNMTLYNLQKYSNNGHYGIMCWQYTAHIY